ncbi:MAG TPA: DnaD domain protein [Clostridiales bacterium]|nr:DnaD domain protein [Clostridiales bacterium]
MAKKDQKRKTSSVSLSVEYLEKGTTQVENKFLEQYLPLANPLHSQVYLYGLYNASNNIPKSFDDIAKDLNLTEEEVLASFKFWENEGLVIVSQTRPYTVSYLSVYNAIPLEVRQGLYDYSELSQELSTLSISKVKGFDIAEIQKVVTAKGIEIPAVKQILNYLITFRKFTSFPAILREFKKYAAEAKTCEEVNELISKNQLTVGAIIEIKKNLLYKNTELEPDARELKLFEKWQKLGYDQNSLMPVATYVSKHFPSPTMFVMDSIVEELADKKILTAMNVNTYLVEKEQFRKLAIEVNKNLGNFEGDLTAIIENYISKWLDLGYTPDSIKTIASICYKYKEINSPQKMDQYIDILNEDNITSEEDVKKLLQTFEENDVAIREIIKSASSQHLISSFDRDLYIYATKTLNYSDEILMLAAEKVKGKVYPINEIIKILQPIYDEGARTVDEVKKSLSKVKDKKVKTKLDPNTHIIGSKDEQIKDFEKALPNISSIVDLRLFD